MKGGKGSVQNKDQGRGRGQRGQGSGGRSKARAIGLGGGYGLGPGGMCVCPNCNFHAPHQLGVPCVEQHCPECGTRMTRVM